MNWLLRILNFLAKSVILLVGLFSLILGICCLYYSLSTLNTGPDVSWSTLSGSFLLLSLLSYGILLSVTGVAAMFAVYNSRRKCFKLYLLLTILCVCAQLGAFFTMKNQHVSTEALVDQTWTEINTRSRNSLQQSFKCCGLTGLSEFARKLDPLDGSCYAGSGQIVRVGCKQSLIQWADERRDGFFTLSIWAMISQATAMFFTIIWLKNFPVEMPFSRSLLRKSLHEQILLGEPSL